MTLLERIENHLKDNEISATKFGRQAVGDPRFVLDLRNGRKPRRKTVMRLEAYLAECCSKGAAVRHGSRQAKSSDLVRQFKCGTNSAMAGLPNEPGSQSRGHTRGGEGDSR